MYVLQKNTTGQDVLDEVAAHLDRLEKDYFGLVFSDKHEERNWLVMDKAVKKQVKGVWNRF